MPHDEYRLDLQDLRCIVQALRHHLIEAVAGHTHHEQIAEADIEEQFGRDPRIRARQDCSERPLPLEGELFALRQTDPRVYRLTGGPSRIAIEERLEHGLVR